MLVLVIAAACGKKDGGGGGSASAAKIDVAGVNALVPAALKDKLVFEQREVKEDSGKHSPTFTLAAPKGWEQKMKMMATLRPPDNANLGFMTEFHLSSNCDGDCVAKDWAATADKVNFAQFASNGSKIDKDEKGKSDRTMVATTEDKRYVVYAWWEDGAKRYHYCSATLEKEVVDAAPAFEKACKAVAVSGED
jgi:hypothetical protein